MTIEAALPALNAETIIDLEMAGSYVLPFRIMKMTDGDYHSFFWREDECSILVGNKKQKNKFLIDLDTGRRGKQNEIRENMLKVFLAWGFYFEEDKKKQDITIVRHKKNLLQKGRTHLVYEMEIPEFAKEKEEEEEE